MADHTVANRLALACDAIFDKNLKVYQAMNESNLPRYIRIGQRDNEWQGADHPDGPWRSIPAPQSGLPWLTDGPAVLKSREPASVAPESTGRRLPLSLAARGIAQEFNDRYELCGPFDDNWQELCLAAALRAVADQVVPEHPIVVPGGRSYEAAWSLTVQDGIRADILAIAAELEETNG